jgi:methyl-accepting chemotaxis protein
MERTIPALKGEGGKAPDRSLFLATFPAWNWLAAISVEESLLDDAIQPIKTATISAMLILGGASLVLIGACGYDAWRIAHGIKEELRKLAAAADAIADGESRMELSYAGDDALGRLVMAFNAMSGAVAAREDSLKARIQVLEINISEQVLAGEVCSIVEDPSFNDLSQRAKAMRQRRNSRSQD